MLLNEEEHDLNLIFKYWGKASPTSPSSQNWHPLVYHSLDVAAVGQQYLASSALLKACCAMLNCSEKAFLSFAAFVLALHDLGKFSEAFQSQRVDLIRELQGREPNPSKRYNTRHDSLGFWLWDSFLAKEVLPIIGIDNSNGNQRIFKCWLRAVTGHHGVPPELDSHTGVDFSYLQQDKQASLIFVKEMANLLLTNDARQIFLDLERKQAQERSELLSWWFAGLTVLADWLGSNTLYFPYNRPVKSIDSYWDYAKAQANTALLHSGVLPATVEKGLTFSELFQNIKVPSPLQKWASNTQISSAPQIYLLEDITGAGKTEAALILAYRLMDQGLAEGFYIGLPTMATANAMYKRVAQFYQKLFTENTNLVLAHGYRKFVEEFAETILPPTTVENDHAQKDDSASARCSAWLADHNKRALLASAGIGTIDQALLAVLHSKHQSLRLLGLLNKVLIVDEVHACDDYMQGVLEVSLEFHARTGGSAILLSATLPSRMKAALLNAYRKGRQQNSEIDLQPNAPYPLATTWSDGQAQATENHLNSRSCVSRTVNIHYESDEEKVFSHIQAALKSGQCVAWIRNTVSDAMEAYRRLSRTTDSDNIVLFHARFALEDRLKKEEQVLSFFGPTSKSSDRKGRLLIATQVAEQSLDVCMDVLITDLAPIDRILQRAGRLQRHVRDQKGNRLLEPNAIDARSAPCLWVYGPEWNAQPTVDWYACVFKKGQYVYDHHGQLWLTARELQRADFNMPSDARTLIEAVYSDLVVLPASLTKNALKAEGKAMADASTAQLNTLKIDGGYERGGTADWWSEGKTPSRLGDETSEIALAKWVDGILQPWAEGVWTRSIVKVASKSINRTEAPADTTQNLAFLQRKQTLPNQGKWCELLALSKRVDGAWEGKAWTLGNAKANNPGKLLTWLYDERFGLRLENSDAN
jgi:CRISPR-associated endonuclease/helicase Cas3